MSSKNYEAPFLLVIIFIAYVKPNFSCVGVKSSIILSFSSIRPCIRKEYLYYQIATINFELPFADQKFEDAINTAPVVQQSRGQQQQQSFQ